MPARSVLIDALQRIAILAVLLTCLLLLWIGAQTPMQIAVLIAIVACAAIRPAEAVLATVAVVPVVRPALAAAGLFAGATAELLVTATVSGCLFRVFVGGSEQTPGNIPAWRAAAIVFAAVAAASLLVELAALRVLISPEVFWLSLWSEIASYASRGRMDLAGRFSPFPAALALFTGSLFCLVVSALPRQSIVATRVLKMFVAGATACALLNIARFAGAVLRSDAPVQALPQLLRSVRISVAFDDVNAAGSFFVLAMFAAMGIALTGARDQGPGSGGTPIRSLAPGLWALCAALCAAALWLSGSRAAFLAGLAAAGLWLVWHGGRVARRVLPALVVAALLGIWAFPNPIVDRSAVGAMSIRMELARVSFRLLADAPVFGIGIGRFYAQSAGEIQDPAVRAIYPRENAHNNFLQIFTELGVVGLASFAVMLAALALRARAISPGSAAAGAAIGIAAFLITCLAGHPLLTPEVSLSFWAVLGALAMYDPDHRASNWRMVAFVTIALLAVSMPVRIASDQRTLNLERVAYGLPDWERDAQGDAFRRMTSRVTLFVPAEATSIELPYRLLQGGGPVTIDVMFGGRSADRLLVADTAWRTFRMSVIKGRDDAPFVPLELRVSAGDASLVGLGRMVVRRGASLPR